MKALLANMQDKFASLQQREKLFVCGGAAAVLLALLFTPAMPQLDRNS